LTLCSETTLVKRLPDRIKVITLFCRSWGCPICAPKRAGQVAHDITRGKPTKFLTLTVNPKVFGSPEERADRLATAFRKWIRIQRKRFPAAEVEYYAVFERTKQGEPHLHVAGRWPYIPQREISQFFDAELSAPVVDIQGARTPKGLARYLSKYLSKDCTKFGTLKRYFRSRAWAPKRPELKEDRLWYGVKWDRSDVSIENWSQLVSVWGWWRAFFDSGSGWQAFDPAEFPPDPGAEDRLNPQRPQEWRHDYEPKQKELL